MQRTRRRATRARTPRGRYCPRCQRYVEDTLGRGPCAECKPEAAAVRNASLAQRARARITRAQRARVYKRCAYRCHLCGGYVPPRERTLDHLVPLAVHVPLRAPRDVELALAHRVCNSRKGAREPE